MPALRAHGAELWTQSYEAAPRHGLRYIENVALPGLGRTRLHSGGNSGHQAINLAYLFGAARIVLLGFDMQQRDPALSHYFGEHPYHKRPLTRNFEAWRRNLALLGADLQAEGVEVLNATRDTALQCFPRVPLEMIP
jgi:uncharacterized Rossmann fold enzyme